MPCLTYASQLGLTKDEEKEKIKAVLLIYNAPNNKITGNYAEMLIMLDGWDVEYVQTTLTFTMRSMMKVFPEESPTNLFDDLAHTPTHRSKTYAHHAFYVTRDRIEHGGKRTAGKDGMVYTGIEQRIE